MQVLVVSVNITELNQIFYFIFKTEEQAKIMVVEVDLDYRSETLD